MKKPELTLENIAPYLPYGLLITGDNGVIIEELDTLSTTSINVKGRSWVYGAWGDISDVKPLLIPLSEFDLSDAYNEINEFHTLGYDNGLFNDAFSDGFDVEYLPYNTMKILFKHHFDVFNLIENGLALNKLEVLK